MAGRHNWVNTRLIRYADDFVVMARYQGARIDEWISGRLEYWLGYRRSCIYRGQSFLS
jgi:hypothetical protein